MTSKDKEPLPVTITDNSYSSGGSVSSGSSVVVDDGGEHGDHVNKARSEGIAALQETSDNDGNTNGMMMVMIKTVIIMLTMILS